MEQTAAPKMERAKRKGRAKAVARKAGMEAKRKLMTTARVSSPMNLRLRRENAAAKSTKLLWSC